MGEAVLFPGQGAQFAGMGKDWFAAFPGAARVFERAEKALGFPLREAIWERGDEVNRTDVAQPGILTTSAAIVAVLLERGLDPAQTALTAGLSLGEYTALWYAGALEFEDAVRLVRLRGEAMQEASERTPSSMTSLMGATREQAEALAAVGRAHGICAVANLNAPGQIVVSGELAALDALEKAAPQHGVKRAVRLSVAGGFHSECMRSAAQRLERALAEVPVRRPRIPFVSNVTATPLSEPAEIKSARAPGLRQCPVGALDAPCPRERHRGRARARTGKRAVRSDAPHRQGRGGLAYAPLGRKTGRSRGAGLSPARLHPPRGMAIVRRG